MSEGGKEDGGFLFTRAMADFDFANKLSFDLSHKEISQRLSLSVTMIALVFVVVSLTEGTGCLFKFICILFVISSIASVISAVLVVRYNVIYTRKIRRQVLQQLCEGKASNAVKDIPTPKCILRCHQVSGWSFVLSILLVGVLASIVLIHKDNSSVGIIKQS